MDKILTKWQKTTENFDYLQEKAAASSISNSRIKHIRLDRDEVESDLADANALMQDVRISPYKRNKKPSGFIISNIPGGSILRKLGLRSRDVIKEVNGQKFSGPDEAIEFFQELATGDDLTIKLRRKRRNRQIKLTRE